MKKLIIMILALFMLAACNAGNDKYYGIDHFYIKEDGDAFQKAYNDMVIDTYEWYRSIEGSEGVYIMHYDHYSAEILSEWVKIGYVNTVPDGDLDYYVASLNYLQDRGFAISDSDRKLIQEGVRYYMIPDTLSEEETAKMKQFLLEDAVVGLDGDTLIDTDFRRDRQIRIVSYHPDVTVEIPGGEEISDPVILVASCANMKYFEAESLVATGLNDGYVRLTEDAYNRFAKNLPESLKKKKVTFVGFSKISK